jgi:hypothetical protein
MATQCVFFDRGNEFLSNTYVNWSIQTHNDAYFVLNNKNTEEDGNTKMAKALSNRNKEKDKMENPVGLRQGK